MPGEVLAAEGVRRTIAGDRPGLVLHERVQRLAGRRSSCLEPSGRVITPSFPAPVGFAVPGATGFQIDAQAPVQRMLVAVSPAGE